MHDAERRTERELLVPAESRRALLSSYDTPNQSSSFGDDVVDWIGQLIIAR